MTKWWVKKKKKKRKWHETYTKKTNKLKFWIGERCRSRWLDEISESCFTTQPSDRPLTRITVGHLYLGTGSHTSNGKWYFFR